ncbi:protein of unknown function [Taphrina deformans PYCC 5710]|uniref:Uncharacterized protein n=1 Tax=Taphrina deformans (strain PYCC 5710 / ATCC 11124 / CBS 356.35 / IMI 108563 / JCM 9778 / NBRC 8474) TaxID=1097556 RepID=R4XGC0_TAPDE|nr:protein of unknown function [Taphrina deformans PYCC 5710]|eukprot:CCG84805.2 protein of unknown function [Taphrina deformans PYCC 5710]
MLDQFPDITPNAMAVWARAQHVAYLLRLRPEALAYLAANRVNKDVQVGYTNLEQVPMPFPLPQKSWSMHVRHGDKGGEMRLVPFREFILTAEKYAMQNPIESRKWAFVSSDDPEVFEVMKKTVSIKDTDTVSNKQWHWFMSNMVRSTEVQFATLEGQANKTVTTLDWLSQLFLALECEAFVGTRGSNWNALIEELRGTWAPAARGPYLDVSREHDWMNYPA